MPFTRARSTPSSRAKRRTPGLACAGVPSSGVGLRPATASGLRSGVAAGAGAGAGAGAAAGAASRGRRRRGAVAGAAARLRRRGRFASPPSSIRIALPSLTLSPILTRSSFTVPDCGRGHLHRRLVALERDQRVVLLHRVAGLHQQLDHRDVLEVADVGNLHFDRGQLRFSSFALFVRRDAASLHRPGSGLVGSMPYFLIASATFVAGTSPSSASAFSAATAT